MLDLNQLRAEFNRYLAEHTHTRRGLDAALLHVCRLAFEAGMREQKALACPRCAGSMGVGVAIEQTSVTGVSDLGGEDGTQYAGGPGRLIPCMKCRNCGHSEHSEMRFDGGSI